MGSGVSLPDIPTTGPHQQRPVTSRIAEHSVRTIISAIVSTGLMGTILYAAAGRYFVTTEDGEKTAKKLEEHTHPVVDNKLETIQKTVDRLEAQQKTNNEILIRMDETMKRMWYRVRNEP